VAPDRQGFLLMEIVDHKLSQAFVSLVVTMFDKLSKYLHLLQQTFSLVETTFDKLYVEFHTLQQTLTQQTTANFSLVVTMLDKLYIKFHAFQQTLKHKLQLGGEYVRQTLHIISCISANLKTANFSLAVTMLDKLYREFDEQTLTQQTS
jgi:hypothetical protein